MHKYETSSYLSIHKLNEINTSLASAQNKNLLNGFIILGSLLFGIRIVPCSDILLDPHSLESMETTRMTQSYKKKIIHDNDFLYKRVRIWIYITNLFRPWI